MKFIFSVLFLFLLVTDFTHGQMMCTRKDTLQILSQTAANENKSLFLVFGHQQCSWCRLFEKYNNDSSVNAIISKYYLVSYMDILNSEDGKFLYSVFGKGGTPSWTIFNDKGNALADSDGGNGNVGYPAEDNELQHYVNVLKKTSSISQEECDFLVDKLKQYRVKKESVVKVE